MSLNNTQRSEIEYFFIITVFCIGYLFDYDCLREQVICAYFNALEFKKLYSGLRVI